MMTEPMSGCPKMSHAGAWFDQARFGLFIHWGLYSIPARGEWMLWNEKIPLDVYNRQADAFRPPQTFSPEAWVLLAKEAGMQYAVFTTRHHDGFSLYPSEANPFNSVRTAAGRDFVAEYVGACRKHGIRVGLYHSLMNWQYRSTLSGPIEDPEDWNAMVAESHAQVRELMTNYGRIDVLWYDGAMVPGGRDPARHWRSDELNRMVRALQPDILINDRAHLPEDFSTPEQEIVAPPAGRRWESCMTMNSSWGYTAGDTNFKSAATILDCLVRCARFGGNLLLNIGPKADGSVPDESVRILKEVGAWMARNGDSVYGSERTSYTEANHVAGPVTQKGGCLYVHLRNGTSGTIRVDGASAATGAEVLGSREVLSAAKGGGSALDVRTAAIPCDTFRPVVCLRFPGGPGAPANMLAGQHDFGLDAGETPALAVACASHYALPEGLLWTGEALAAVATDGRRADLRESDAWCPGLRLPVYAHAMTGDAIDFEQPTTGLYDLKLGVISRNGQPVRFSLNGRDLPMAWVPANPGSPDTVVLPQITLTTGRVRLRLEGGVDAGLYALQCVPKWRPLPTRHWLALGPFPTAFDPRQPESTIREALTREYGPEHEFDPGKRYEGLGGMIRWLDASATTERGLFDASGVDFSRRCPHGGQGVCFARTVIVSGTAQTVEAAIHVDWWANIFLNGQKLHGGRTAGEIAIDGAEFSTFHAVRIPLPLQAGENVLLVKNHSGSRASGFCLYLNAPESVRPAQHAVPERSVKPGGPGSS